MKKAYGILVGLFIIAVIPFTVYLAQQQQTYTQHAQEPMPPVRLPSPTVTSPIFTPTPTPPSANCYYRHPVCNRVCPVNNPNCCPVILVCPTPRPTL